MNENLSLNPVVKFLEEISPSGKTRAPGVCEGPD